MQQSVSIVLEEVFVSYRGESISAQTLLVVKHIHSKCFEVKLFNFFNYSSDNSWCQPNRRSKVKDQKHVP